MIKSSNLNKLKQLDLFQVIKNILSFLQAANPTALMLEKVYNDLLNAFNAFDEAIIRARKTGLTDSISTLDAERDGFYRGFVSFVKGCAKMPSGEIVDAAKAILAVVEKYPYIPTLPLREETAAITNLAQDLRVPEMLAKVTLIGALPVCKAVEEKNLAFEMLYNQRTEKEAMEILELAKTTRLAVEEAFRKVAYAINGLEVAMGEAPYKVLCDQINREVSRAQQ